jgi:hypothetical protein
MRSVLLIFVFALALLADLTDGSAQERVLAPVVLQAPSVNVQQTYADLALAQPRKSCRG